MKIMSIVKRDLQDPSIKQPPKFIPRVPGHKTLKNKE